MQNIDWNNANEDSCVYFGALYTTNNTVSSSSILRLKLTTPITESAITTLATGLKPIVKAPLLVRDKNDFWVFAGSGRLLTKNDILNINNQFLYGIREPLDKQGNLSFAAIDANQLVDVTDVEISTTNEIRNTNTDISNEFYIDNNKITAFEQLEENISRKYGWKKNLDKSNGPGYLQLQPQKLSSLILFTEFKPRQHNYFVGDRYLHILHYKTGTASIRYKLTKSIEASNNDIAITRFSAGIGYSSSNYIQIKTSIEDGTKVIIPNSSNEIIISANPNNNKGDHSANRLSWRRIK